MAGGKLANTDNNPVAEATDVAVDPQGDVCAAYGYYDAVYLYVYAAGGSGWITAGGFSSGYGPRLAAISSTSCGMAFVAHTSMVSIDLLQYSVTDGTATANGPIQVTSGGGTIEIAGAPAQPAEAIVWSSADTVSVIHAYVSDGTFSTSTLSDSTVNASSPAVAMDLAGDTGAIWLQSGSAFLDVVASRRPRSGSWSMWTVISDGKASAASPSIASDDQGDFLAVWQELVGSLNQIFVARWSAATGQWSASTRVSNNTAAASNPSVALDANGNGIVAGEQASGSNTDVWTARYAGALGARRRYPPTGST